MARKIRVALVGDSQAQGLSPHLGAELARHSMRLIARLTIPGVSTRRLLDRHLDELREAVRGADRVIVALGGNDYGLGTDAGRAAYRARLRRMRRELKGKDVLWLGPAFALDRGVARIHDRARAQQKRFFRSTPVRWVDSYPATRSGHAPDGVHFTRERYARWARAVATKAKELGGAGWGWPLAIGAAAVVIASLIRRKRRRSPRVELYTTAHIPRLRPTSADC